jgi:hypothetical protein
MFGDRGGDRDMLRRLIRRVRTKIEPDPLTPPISDGPREGLRPAHDASARNYPSDIL